MYDRDTLLERFDGDETLLHDILTLFLEDSLKNLDDVRQGIASGNAKQTLLGAHTVGSSLRLFGAFETAEVAAALEKMARDEELGEAAPKLERLDQGLAQVRAVLEEYIRPAAES